MVIRFTDSLGKMDFETDILARIQPAIDLTIQLGMLISVWLVMFPISLHKNISAQNHKAFTRVRKQILNCGASQYQRQSRTRKDSSYVDQTYRGKAFTGYYY